MQPRWGSRRFRGGSTARESSRTWLRAEHRRLARRARRWPPGLRQAGARRFLPAVARIRSELARYGLAPDPGLANLRVAARAAIAHPLVLAFGMLVLHNEHMTLFMVFAVSALSLSRT